MKSLSTKKRLSKLEIIRLETAAANKLANAYKKLTAAKREFDCIKKSGVVETKADAFKDQSFLFDRKYWEEILEQSLESAKEHRNNLDREDKKSGDCVGK